MSPKLKRSALLLALALQGCSLAPTYKPPVLDLPQHYREQTSDGPVRSRVTACRHSGGALIRMSA